MPLNSRDRFFSMHNADHYALYLWQPNRSSWGEDDPIEALVVWDISSPSSYRPSEDPTREHKPDDSLEGARVIMRLSFSGLDFYQIRQRATPVLKGLELDENHVYVIEENHRWIVGQQASYTLPRLHEVKTIGIPFTVGPRVCIFSEHLFPDGVITNCEISQWEDNCGIDGDVSLSFCERTSNIRRPNLAPCWRHEVSQDARASYTKTLTHLGISVPDYYRSSRCRSWRYVFSEHSFPDLAGGDSETL
jgi:hypothetical protein